MHDESSVGMLKAKFDGLIETEAWDGDDVVRIDYCSVQVVAIWFLATGESQRDVAFNFLAGRSPVSSIVSEVTAAFWCVLEPMRLQHPKTADQWMMKAFSATKKMPSVCCIALLRCMNLPQLLKEGFKVVVRIL
ncbi:hypothetical protein MTO96_044921 [Rhipicephalus appendiculatus]